MGLLDFILQPKEIIIKNDEDDLNIDDLVQNDSDLKDKESDQLSTDLGNEMKEIKENQSLKEKATKNLPRAIRELQIQLNPTLMTPTSRKRPVKRSRKLQEEQEAEMLTPTRKRRIVTEKKVKEETTGLVSPPITPSKIIKPTFALTDLKDKSSSKDPASKKLDFSSVSSVTKTQLAPITPPVTPVKQESKTLTPTSEPPKQPDFTAFIENKENIPPTPFTTPIKPKSIFTRAKAIFQRSFNQELTSILPERENEGKALNDFFLENIMEKKSTSLYISGPPGTGKTAQTTLTLSQLIDLDSAKKVQLCEINGNDYKLRYTYINCMTVSRASNIYQEIYSSLTDNQTTIANSKEALIEALSDIKEADMNIIILDELDKLITADQQILFEIFSWVIHRQVKMILIGISNALDMVDRLLPRLKINGLNPNTLSFLPYDSDQIENIIKSRLCLLNEEPSDSSNIPLIHPAAIKFAAKKSSSNTGDLRKAFDICRKAIELVEREVRGNNVFCDNKLNSIDQSSILVKINHVARVCSNVFNQNQSSKLTNLNFLQKHIVCLLVKAENEFRLINKKGLSINTFYEYYLKNGRIDSLVGSLRKGEFLEVLTAIESVGIIQSSKFKKQNHSESMISSHLAKKDLYESIKGIKALENLVKEEGEE